MQLLELLIAIAITIIMITVKMAKAIRVMDPVFTSFFIYLGLIIALFSDENYQSFYTDVADKTSLLHLQKLFFNPAINEDQKNMLIGLCLFIIPAAICIPVYILERDRNLYNNVEKWTKYTMMCVNLFFFYKFMILFESFFYLKDFSKPLEERQIADAWGKAILWTIFFLILHILMLRKDTKKQLGLTY